MPCCVLPTGLTNGGVVDGVHHVTGLCCRFVSKSFRATTLATPPYTGLVVRLFLYELGLQPRLESVMELVVPSASWERAQEGLYLSTL